MIKFPWRIFILTVSFSYVKLLAHIKLHNIHFFMVVFELFVGNINFAIAKHLLTNGFQSLIVALITISLKKFKGKLVYFQRQFSRFLLV